MRKAIFSLIVALAAIACTEDNPVYNANPLLPGECREGTESTETFETFERPEKLDVLFIVDNAGDVEDLQQSMAVAAAQWLDGLKDDLDIEVAVATTDGTVGPRLAPPGTSAMGCEGNTAQVAKSSQSNFSRLIACNIIQGDAGNPFQQSLAVLDGLVFGTSPETLGFFRSDARLLVVVLSNEDDCSHEGTLSGDGPPRQVCSDNAADLDSVTDLVDKLQTLRQTTQGFALAVIAGPPATGDSTELRPVCSSSLGAAYPSPRLYATARLLDDRGQFFSACAEDFITILGDLTDRFARANTVSLCPSKALVQEPLDVTAFDADDEPTPIRLGSSGFQFLGPTDHCPNGEFGFNAAALEGTARVEVTYCVAE
ncbi:MAG: hypothetical protein R3E66_17210 [bacterium]